MIASLSGRLVTKGEHTVIVSVGGVGFRVIAPVRTIMNLPSVGEEVELVTYLHVREEALDLFGFESGEVRDLFEMLISVNGVGPKSAVAILDIADLSELKAAIAEGRPDLMTKASGIGRKTAERIVLELKGKVFATGSQKTVAVMEGDMDLLETLAGLGYRREEAKAALQKIDASVVGLEARLKAALKVLKR